MDSIRLGNLLVGQSGGPTAVINASLYGIILEALENTDKIGTVYGMINGIEGFIADNYMNLSSEFVKTDLEALKTTPSAYLGSCRYKLPEDLSDLTYPLIFEKFLKHNILYFIYIGGNDSMDTVSKLSRYAEMIHSPVKIIGIPKTIDNDLENTDHSPGYGSAAKYVATTVRDIVLDANAYDTNSVTIIELMGRHAGWITASSVLARKYAGDNPCIISLPEAAFDVDSFIKKVAEELTIHRNVIVCVSEGIKDKSGRFICEYSGETGVDSFGHKMLNGCGKYLENVVQNILKVKCRSVELNVNQRCTAVLGSLTDINEAAMAGAFGVRAALSGSTGKMIAFKRESTVPYKITCEEVDCHLVCNREKAVPLEWISDNYYDIRDEFVAYALPLIQGESRPDTKDGLPVYCYRKVRRKVRK